MKAYVLLAGSENLDSLKLVERPEPAPGPGQILVRIRACSLNYRDQAVLTGRYFGGKLQRDTIPLSDGAGEVTVTPGRSPIQMLFVKSDGTFIARLPIVPGAEARVAVPLPDDDERLRVAARLTALREDMVDLVARRNIAVARVRRQIEAKNFDQARVLLESLDQLPGATQFSRQLDREAQLHRTKDVQVQRRIDSLFSQTRTALGKFLDPRPIGELHEELQQAESPAAETSSDGETTTAKPRSASNRSS